MKKFFTGYCDMNSGKPLENGHIVAVRYVWNSYVGEISRYNETAQLHASGAKRHTFNSPHDLKPIHTYQIISHINPLHEDYIKGVSDWYMNEEGGLPIELTIYHNTEGYETDLVEI